MKTLPLCGLLIFYFLGLQAQAQEATVARDALFQQKTFQLPGRVRLVILDDMDADGLKDMIVFYTAGEYPGQQRKGCIFWQEPQEGFPQKPNICWPVPVEASLVDIGDVDGVPGREIFYMTSNGIIHFPFVSRTHSLPNLILKEDTYLLIPETQELPQVDFVRNWDGDGAEEIMVFKSKETLIYKRNPDGVLAEKSRLKLTPRAYLRSAPPPPSLERNHLFRESLWVPQIVSRDFNGDGLDDLIATWMDELAIYLQEAGGFYPAEPSAIYHFNVMSETERITGRTTVHAEVEDLQADGKADLVLSVISGGIANLKSKILIYFNNSGKFTPDSPDLALKGQKGAAGAILHDANSDGRLDLVIPSMDTGILSYVKMFLTRQIDINFAFYLMGREGQYPLNPNHESELKFAIDLAEGDIVGMMPRLNGDFNGDGRKDVVFAAEKDRLTVIFQGAGDVFPPSNTHVFEAPVSKQMLIEDIDGDGKSDILLFYSYDDTQKHVIRLLYNKWGKISH